MNLSAPSSPFTEPLLRQLATKAERLFRLEGWARYPDQLQISLPMEQWYVPWSPSAGPMPSRSLETLTKRRVYFYHQVLLRQDGTSRAIGELETRIQDDEVIIARAGLGSLSAHVQAVLARLRGQSARPRAKLCLLAMEHHHLIALWRRCPETDGELWVVYAEAEGPFSIGEGMSEAEFLRRLRNTGGKRNG